MIRARALIRFAPVGVLVALAGTGCSVENPKAPALAGPSEFGLSITLTATPDRLPRDASSESVVTVTVRDAQSRPVGGQRLALAVNVAEATLSASEVVTDQAGRATFAVTAPPQTAQVPDNQLVVEVSPVGQDADSSRSRFVAIALSGAANTTAPTPSFTVTPASPEVKQVTTLDASATTDEGATCGDACTYSWDLGGEATRTGRIITYQFQTVRIHNVALTVTDAAGSSATTRTNVTVTAAARPTVSFTVAPTAPTAGQPATFTATSTVAANHLITRFDWNWGDGSTANQTSNAAITHTFSTAGTYIVTVTVTDDLGQTASSTSSVTVGSGVTARFTFSPTNPKTTDDVQFNGSESTSTGGATISEWAWDFGDGDTSTETDATTSHKFNKFGAVARTYKVRLTVKDSNGRTGTLTQDVAVTVP